MPRWSRVLSSALLALPVTMVPAALTPRAAAARPPVLDLPAPDSHGITLESLTEVDGDPRMLDAVMRTKAIYQPVHVRIYLPEGYRETPSKRYPSLYLLHGANDPLDDAQPWAAPAPAESGRIADTLRDTPFNGITVMPEGGKSGFYTDWAVGDAAGRRPQWETFHIRQLLPWVDANFRSVPDRARRTVAGLSMGGFGALSYAGRHPDLFSAVAAFSPPTDIVDDLVAQQLIVGANLTQIAGSSITTEQLNRAREDGHLARDITHVFGPYGTWKPLNPYHLTGRLKDLELALYVGDASDFLEGLARGQADKLHYKLRDEGSTHRYCRGKGTHTWPYWREDLRDFIHYRFGTTPPTCPNGWGEPVP